MTPHPNCATCDGQIARSNCLVLADQCPFNPEDYHQTLAITMEPKIVHRGDASGGRTLKPLEEDVVAVEKVSEEEFFEIQRLKDESIGGAHTEWEKLKKELSL